MLKTTSNLSAQRSLYGHREGASIKQMLWDVYASIAIASLHRGRVCIVAGHPLNLFQFRLKLAHNFTTAKLSLIFNLYRLTRLQPSALWSKKCCGPSMTKRSDLVTMRERQSILAQLTKDSKRSYTRWFCQAPMGQLAVLVANV